MNGHTLFYSLHGFKACFEHEVGGTPLLETTRSLLERYKNHSTPYDILISQPLLLTRAFLNDDLCPPPMLEAALAFVSRFFATHVLTSIMVEDDHVFLNSQAIFYLEDVMPRKMLEMIKGNPLRYWQVGGEMAEDLQTITRGIRLNTASSFVSFRVESVVSYAEQFSLQVDTLSPDEILCTHRLTPMAVGE